MLKYTNKINIADKLNSDLSVYNFNIAFLLKIMKKHCGYIITFSKIKFVAVFEFLFILYFIKTGNLSKRFFLMLHKLVSRKLDTKYKGEFRKEKVEIIFDPASRPEWQKLDGLFKEFLRDYSKNKKTMHPIVFVSWVHLRIVDMHPFKDANGRVAVLLSNLILFHYKYSVILNFRSDLNIYDRYIKGVQKYIATGEINLFVDRVVRNIIHHQILLLKTVIKLKNN